MNKFVANDSMIRVHNLLRWLFSVGLDLQYGRKALDFLLNFDTLLFDKKDSLGLHGHRRRMCSVFE